MQVGMASGVPVYHTVNKNKTISGINVYISFRFVGVLLLFYPPKLPPILAWKTLEKSHRFQWDEGEAGGAGEALSSALCTAQRLQQFAAPPDDRSETTGREGCIKTIYLSIHPCNLI